MGDFATVWELRQDLGSDGRHTDADCGPVCVAFLRHGGALASARVPPREWIEGEPRTFDRAFLDGLCRRMRAETAGASQDQDQGGVTVPEVVEMCREFAGVWQGEPGGWWVRAAEPLTYPGVSGGAPAMRVGRGGKLLLDGPVEAACDVVVRELEAALEASPRGVIVSLIPFYDANLEAPNPVEEFQGRKTTDDLRHYVCVTGTSADGAGFVLFDPWHGRVTRSKLTVAYCHLWACARPPASGRLMDDVELTVKPELVAEHGAVPRLRPGAVVFRGDHGTWVARGPVLYHLDHGEADARAQASALALPRAERERAVAAVVEAPPGTFIGFKAVREESAAEPFEFVHPTSSMLFFRWTTNPATAEAAVVPSEVDRPDDEQVHTHRT